MLIPHTTHIWIPRVVRKWEKVQIPEKLRRTFDHDLLCNLRIVNVDHWVVEVVGQGDRSSSAFVSLSCHAVA